MDDDVWTSPGYLKVSFVQSSALGAPDSKVVILVHVATGGDVLAFDTAQSQLGLVVTNIRWTGSGPVVSTSGSTCAKDEKDPSALNVRQLLADSFGPVSDQDPSGWTVHDQYAERPGAREGVVERVIRNPLADRRVQAIDAAGTLVGETHAISVERVESSATVPGCGQPAP